MRTPRPSLVLLLLVADLVAVGGLAGLVLMSSGGSPTPARAASASQATASTTDLGGSAADGSGPPLFVVTGDGAVDALAADAAASALGSPVLPVINGSLSPAIRRALARLAPSRVVVVGGSDAVDDELTAQLREVTGGEVLRLAGENRFDTAAQVATTVFRRPVPQVLVTTGREPVDRSSRTGSRGPVLLVTPDGVPPETARALEALQPQVIAVLRGAQEASPALLRALERYAPGGVRQVSAAAR